MTSRAAMLTAALLLWPRSPLIGQSAPDSSALRQSVQQLRETRGSWSVETNFLDSTGKSVYRATGTYRFDWVIEDKMLAGVSQQPALESTAGILFYVSASRGVIEMLSVGPDGSAWTMTGPLGEEARQSQSFKTPAGKDRRLRFTRFGTFPDSFQSRMEFSDDSGKTWVPGNHQVFRRARNLSYGFITRLGDDTVAVERVTVRGAETVIDLLEVSPRAVLTTIRIQRTPFGRIQTIQFTARGLNSPATTQPFTHRLAIDGDSGTVTMLSGDSVTNGPRRVALTGALAPWQLYGVATYEAIVAAARDAGGDSVSITTISLGAAQPGRILVRRQSLSQYSVQVFPGAPFEATLDAVGSLQRFSGRATTIKIESERTGPLPEFEALIQRMAARARSATR